MLFKSMGVAAATHSSVSNEDYKPVTLRLSESEVQLYDAIGKTMGLNRQDFLAHLIRNNFKQALSDFLIGYTESSPSVSLCELIHSNTDSEEVKTKISWMLRSISQDLMEQDEKAIHEHIENSERFYEYATPRKGIFAEKPKSEEN